MCISEHALAACRQMVGWRAAEWDSGVWRKAFWHLMLGNMKHLFSNNTVREPSPWLSPVFFLSDLEVKGFSNLCISEYADVSFPRRLPYPVLVPAYIPSPVSPGSCWRRSPCSENMVGIKLARKR